MSAISSSISASFELIMYQFVQRGFKGLIERKLPSLKGAVILNYKEYVRNGASANAGFVDKSETTAREAWVARASPKAIRKSFYLCFRL
jgi:hypothetical protein